MSLRPNTPRNQRNSPSPSRPRLGDTYFRYRDIDIRKNEIRLLRVFPGVEGSMIECELFRNSLDNSRNYTALSYTWGIAEHTKLVKLGGFDFPVTDNLESALQRLRSSQNTVILWVDAICINQDSVKERNHQVGFMRRIYKTARRVAVWLGPEGENSMAAMDLIWTLYWNPELLGRMVEDPDLLQDFKAIVLLFCRDYWDRIWVVQEVVNAKKIAVYCGKDAIPWHMLDAVSALFQSQRKKITSAFYDYSWKKLSWGGTLSYGGPGKLDDQRFRDASSALLETLIFHREKLCAKPEDKVYGILGVLWTHERKQFQVDYKLSPREVFLNVTRYLLENTQRLDFLGSAVPQEPNIHRVPSWVPDWEYRAEISPLTVSNRYRPKFAAAGTTKAKASISGDGEVLKWEGVYIDSIKNLGIPLPAETSEPAEVLTFLEWYSILVRYQEDITPEDHEDFCRAIWLDSNREGWTPIDRMEWTYRTFASLSREFSGQALDERLTSYADSFREHMRAQRTEIFQSYIPGAIRGRRFMISATGLQGIAPADCDIKDIICVPLGSATPMVLRKEDESQHYTFVGECYINSYMYGKAISEVNAGIRRLETFEIR